MLPSSYKVYNEIIGTGFTIRVQFEHHMIIVNESAVLPLIEASDPSFASFSNNFTNCNLGGGIQPVGPIII